MAKPSLRKRRLMRIAAGTLLVLPVVSAIVLGVSYHIYYSAPAADLPCRGCSGEARAVHIDRFELYYRQLVTDTRIPPVVIVHGGPGSSSVSLKNGFDFLAEDHLVVYYDQRGSGNSQIKPDPAHYTIDLLVEELEAIRRDVIGADRIILVGHSAGGALVQRYALAYSDRVESMVLISSIPANGGRKASGLLAEAYDAALDVLSGAVPPGNAEEADAEFQEDGDEDFVARLYDPSNRHLVMDRGYTSWATYREVTRSTLGGDFDAALQQLAVKTLLVNGVADSDWMEPVMAELHGLLPNSTLVRFEESGHWPFLEEPERFQQVMRSFLESE